MSDDNYFDTDCINCLNGYDCDSKQIGNCTYICRLGTITETEFMQQIDDEICYRPDDYVLASGKYVKKNNKNNKK